MSYKSNAIINRVKQTIGWQPWVQTTQPDKKLNISNIHGVKIAYFLKHWFKVQNWVLLSVRRFNSRQTQIWYVTALRIPKHLRDSSKNIPFFEEDINIAWEAQRFFFYKKRINKVFKRYAHRKKTLFNFTRAFRIMKARSFIVKKENNLQKSKKSWLKLFVGSYKFDVLTNRRLLIRKTKNKRLFTKILPYRNFTKGIFFFPTREWKNVTARKFFPRITVAEATTIRYEQNTKKLLKRKQYITTNTILYNSQNYINIKKKTLRLKKKSKIQKKVILLGLKNLQKIKSFINSKTTNNKNPGDYLNTWYWGLKNKILLKKQFSARFYTLALSSKKLQIKIKKVKKLQQKWLSKQVLSLVNNTLKKIRKNKYLLTILAQIKGGHLKKKLKQQKIIKIKTRLKFLYLKKKMFHKQPYNFLVKTNTQFARNKNKKCYVFYKGFSKKFWNVPEEFSNLSDKYISPTYFKRTSATYKKKTIAKKKQLVYRKFKQAIYQVLHCKPPHIIFKNQLYGVLKKLVKKQRHIVSIFFDKKQKLFLGNKKTKTVLLKISKNKKLLKTLLFFKKKKVISWKKHCLAEKKAKNKKINFFKKSNFFSKISQKSKNKKSSYLKMLRKFTVIYKGLVKVKPIEAKYKVYKCWKRLYLLKLTQKRIIIKNFLKLWQNSIKTKKHAVRLNKNIFVKKKHSKKKNYKNSLFLQLSSKIMLWSALRQKVPLRKYKFIKQHNLTNLVKLYEKTQTGKPKAKKLNYIQTTKMNFLFKKTLRLLFKKTNPGVATVKFLQPTGKLLSMKKIRVMASKINDLQRYRRQKLYRRVIRTLSIFFRYWHPQPLLEQIAFEMEKTKKHWPILKTIKTLIVKLKPVHFHGYRIAIRGKINSSDRTRVFFIKHGNNIPISSFTNRMIYSMWHSHARTGVFSIKGWVYFPLAINFNKKKTNSKIPIK